MYYVMYSLNHFVSLFINHMNVDKIFKKKSKIKWTVGYLEINGSGVTDRMWCVPSTMSCVLLVMWCEVVLLWYVSSEVFSAWCHMLPIWCDFLPLLCPVFSVWHKVFPDLICSQCYIMCSLSDWHHMFPVWCDLVLIQCHVFPCLMQCVP